MFMCVSTCVLHSCGHQRHDTGYFPPFQELQYNVLELHTCSLQHEQRICLMQTIAEKKSLSREAPHNHLFEPKILQLYILLYNSNIKASNLLFLITLFQSFVFLLLIIT